MAVADLGVHKRHEIRLIPGGVYTTCLSSGNGLCDLVVLGVDVEGVSKLLHRHPRQTHLVLGGYWQGGLLCVRVSVCARARAWRVLAGAPLV